MRLWRGWVIGRALALAVGAVGVLSAPAASAECKFRKLADLPVVMDGLRPTVTAKINGQDATFLVDSGAFYSMVSSDAVARFGMSHISAPYGMRIGGVGGHQEDAQAARAQVFTFAGVPFTNVEFLVAQRAGGAGTVGLLGQNFMGVLDVEYDLANGVIRLLKPEGCGDKNLAYWSAGKDLSVVRLEDVGTFVPHVKITAKIDGHTIRVTLDSGSTVSYLSRPAASRAGIQPSSDGVTAGEITYGLFGKGMETSLAPFESFAIGSEEIKHTRLRVAAIDLPDSEMLLGADFFLSHRILVSKSQGKLYFTYNGGPVFQLGHSATAQRAQPAAPASTPDALTAPNGPATAAEFSRRGAASMARRDYPAALADFTRAIELEPSSGHHYHDRAMVRLANHQPVLAMADLDQALKYKPDDIAALMIRGELSLSAGDDRRAQEDFDAALKLSPDDHALPPRIAASYFHAGHYDAALRRQDAWIALLTARKVDPVAMAEALNARCKTRAIWGQQLDLALADCDAALKRTRSSDILDDRGLVLLRLGRMQEAIAQYDAALRLQPKAATALYGRGLAKRRNGAIAEGDADIAAAIAIDPDLPKQAKRFGIETPTTAAAIAGKS